jgi:antitoxin ParD1/3/4
MRTMNITLPDSLQEFVDEQVAERGFANDSDYLGELIRQEAARLPLRELLIEGAESPAAAAADEQYFDTLRDRVRKSGPA